MGLPLREGQKWAAGPAVLSALGLLPRSTRSAVLQGSASLPGKEMQQAAGLRR